VPAGQAVFVGDTVWDVQASRKAGVLCIGLLSAGIGRKGGQSPSHGQRKQAGPRPSRTRGALNAAWQGKDR
jgi:phosphoglycolate phosphatase-like HAD superfamily hydrolase